MFWFSPKALQTIHLCEDYSITFEDEDEKQDGTLAHAWERAFCILSKQLGYSVSATEAEGADLSLVNNLENKIPVLNLDSIGK
jgi:rhamnosyltransferase